MVRPIDRARVLVARAISGAPASQPVKPAPTPAPRTPPATAPGVRPAPTPQAPMMPSPPPVRPRPRKRRPPASYLMGRLMDASTRLPVKGGVVLVIKPGVNVTALSRQNLRRFVYTMGVSNSLGQFRTRLPLAQGWTYGVVVLSRGYRVVRVNRAVSVRRGARPLLTVGVLRLQRLRY
jgi:hypothetical protein